MRTIEEQTLDEVTAMLEAGMIQLSKDEFLNTLDRLGYELKMSDTFNYINTGNKPNHYKAKSVSYYKEKDTGVNFAHYLDARRDENFRKLQELRRSCFVFENGRIWEL